MNTQIVPEQHVPSMPPFPFASPAAMLAAAEEYFGTRQLADALKTLRDDRDFTDRSLAANPTEIASIRALAGPRIPAEMLTALDQAATVPFYPGIAA